MDSSKTIVDDINEIVESYPIPKDASLDTFRELVYKDCRDYLDEALELDVISSYNLEVQIEELTWNDIYPSFITRFYKKACIYLLGNNVPFKLYLLMLGYDLKCDLSDHDRHVMACKGMGPSCLLKLQEDHIEDLNATCYIDIPRKAPTVSISVHHNSEDT